jgi:hypothetical protein
MRGNIAVYMIMLIAVIWGLFILFPTPSMDLNEDNAGFYLNLMEKLNITNTTINVSGANGSLESARLVSNETGEWIAGDVILNDGNIVMNGSSQEVDGVDISVLESDFSSHEGDTDNPHEVTKTQVGLGDVENTALSTWGGSEYITNTGVLSDLNVTQTSTSGFGVYINRDLNSSESDSPIAYIKNLNGSDDKASLGLYTNGSGQCLTMVKPAGSTGKLIEAWTSSTDNSAIWIVGDSTYQGITGDYGLLSLTRSTYNEDVWLMGAKDTNFAYIRRNLADATGNVLYVSQDHKDSTSNSVAIRHDGTGDSINIDLNGNGNGIVIDSESTDAKLLSIESSGIRASDRPIIQLWDDSATPKNNSNGMLSIQSQHASNTADNIYVRRISGTGTILNLVQETIGNTIYIDHNGATGTALSIDTVSSSWGMALKRVSSDTSYAPLIAYDDYSGAWSNYAFFGANRNDGSNRFNRNIASNVTNGAVVSIRQDHASDDQSALSIIDDGDTGSSSGSLYISTTNSNNDNAIYHSSGAKLTQTGTWTNAPSYSWLKTTVQSSKDMNVLDIFRNLDLQSWTWKDVYRCSVQDNYNMDGDVTKDTVCLNNYITDKDIHYGAYLDDMGESFGINTDGVNTQDWIGINQIAIQQLIEKIDSLENRLNTICKNNPDLRECYGG